MYSHLLRLTLQHRAFYCYILLSLWIFVLLGVMYKYVGSESGTLNLAKYHTTEVSELQESPNYGTLVKSKKVTKFCNAYKDIRPGAEGNFNSNYTLEGVVVLIRHGDRGPMTHVVNASAVNCDGSFDPLYSSFENYIKNITGTPILSQLLGVFRKIHSPLPVGGCYIGLLTKTGASQLLATGRVLREVYKHSLNISSSRIKDEIKVYSTSYSRTVHSALAFLYSFMEEEDYPKILFQAASSLTFCFDDCACPKANYYLDKFMSESSKHLHSHPAVYNLVKSASSIVYEFPHKKLSTDPHALKDALLTYICHDSSLPCKDSSLKSDKCIKLEHVNGLFTYLNWEAKQSSKSQNFKKGSLLRAYGLLKNIITYLLQIVSEKKPRLILYSGHDKTLSYLTSALGITSDGVFSPYYASRLIFEETCTDKCIKLEHVNGLFTYLNWEAKQSSKSQNFKKGSLLRAYGLLKNIITYLLQIVSEKKPRLILYSGHDKTLSYLTSALGITSDGVFSPYYASRLIFEVYRSKTVKGEPSGPVGSDFFFRLLFNGKDITTKVQFCKGVPNHHPARQQNVTGFRNTSFFLCPLESIVRFLHDDYFLPFNATNMKDSCSL